MRSYYSTMDSMNDLMNNLIFDDINCIDSIDSILDNKLVKFDHNQQTSMYFIVHKSINALCRELYNSEKNIIPKNIIQKIMFETAPSYIREYNGNIRKRCRAANLNNSSTASTASSTSILDINNIILDNTICLARKIDGGQCTRKKYNNNDLCKNHMKKLPNGRITAPAIIPDSTNMPQTKLTLNDGRPDLQSRNYKEEEGKAQSTEHQSKDKDTNNNQIPTKQIKPLKRGRKSKIQFDPRQYDNEYITLWEDIVEGEKVLIDNANNIYTFDLEHPVYIGKKDITKTLNIKQIMSSLAKEPGQLTSS